MPSIKLLVNTIFTDLKAEQAVILLPQLSGSEISDTKVNNKCIPRYP